MSRAGPMLGHALRRLLWTLPTLVLVSVVSFLFLSYVPDPTDDPRWAGAQSRQDVEEARRERFLDLPRFVNLSPRDVTVRAAEALQLVAQGGPGSDIAAENLVRLGGAALPHVLPALDGLAPEPRLRVALALAPLARRMGLPVAREASDASKSVRFWARFWDERGVELRTSRVHTAVSRLVRFRSASRIREVASLDTFALDEVMNALEMPHDEGSIDEARALIDVAVRVTGRNDAIAEGASLNDARGAVARWKRYWRVHQTDFVVLAGTARVSAALRETRYGKWAEEAVAERLGRTVTGRTVVAELHERGPTTLALMLGALLVAYGIAIPLGTIAAIYRNRKLDLMLAAGVLLVYVVPTAVAAVLTQRLLGSGSSLLVPTLVLAAGLVAAPTRVQRSALVNALNNDYVRTARAKGAGPARAVFRHGLRNTLAPVLTLAALEPPMAIGGAFVVERVFGLNGLGEITIRAVEARDVAWLMALSIAAAGAAAFFVVLTDLSYALLDPRLSGRLFGARR